MKIKSLIISTGLALVAGAGLFFGLNQKSEVKNAKAVSTDTLMYVETRGIGDWNDGAVTMAWLSGDGKTSKWTLAEDFSGTIKSYTMPAGYTKATVCRFSSSNHPADESEYWWNDNWGQAYDFEPGDTLNCIQLTGYSDGKAAFNAGYLKHISIGDYFYFTPSFNNNDWFKDGAKTRLSFWNGKYIDGEIVSSSSLVQFEAKEEIYTIGFNFFRINPSDDSLWGQTVDYTFLSTNVSVNAFVAETQEGHATFLDGGCLAYGDNYLAISYGVHFLNSTKVICATTSESADHSTALSDKWGSLESSYNALLSDTNKKNAFRDSTNTKAIDAKARYAHIIARYTALDRFVSGVSPAYSNGSIAISSNNNTPTIIVVTSAIALISLGGFIFLRKRKEI